MVYLSINWLVINGDGYMRPKDPRVAHKPKCLKFTPSSFEIIDNYSNK